jgi:hypothetical protein
MIKLLSFFIFLSFLSVSFTYEGHFHKDTETGSKADCPLCLFSHTTPVVPSAPTVSLTSIILQKMNAPPVVAIAAPLFILPDPRAPPPLI